MQPKTPLSTRQAAVLLGISQPMVLKLIRERKLHATKIDRLGYVIDPADVERQRRQRLILGLPVGPEDGGQG